MWPVVSPTGGAGGGGTAGEPGQPCAGGIGGCRRRGRVLSRLPPACAPAPHSLLHPLPLRLVPATDARTLYDPGGPTVHQHLPRRRRAQRQAVISSASARSASRYEPMPKPATVPVATAAMTEVCRNSSRAYGFEMCTSISGAVRWAAASRIPYE